jgi:DNA-binding LytR/AlgR family response regulator
MMNLPSKPTAIIADDEEHLRTHLRNKLAKVWPQLQILAECTNGLEAREAIEDLQPSIAFLDIKMPGLTGLQVAQSTEGLTRFVFVTAYDQFALEAFEREAVDFLVKPVLDERLDKTVKRLRQALDAADPAPQLAQLLQSLQLAATPAPTQRLRWLRANRSDTTVHVPMQEVLYMQSDDKYTIAYTATQEHIVRMPIVDMIAALDPEQFWQIHRSTIVNMNFVEGTRRDEGGRLFVKIRGKAAELAVSRAWVHLFRQM